MIFTPTALAGVYLVDIERHTDERGFFSRTWCAEEFAQQGLDPHLAQASISFNLRRGTVRGLHMQAAPFAETKLVRCTMGAIFDVVVDCRPNSPTFKQWLGAELTSTNRRALYIPEGLAHGFQTLRDETEVSYYMNQPFKPSASTGFRWNDSAFAISWPLAVTVISERDRSFPDIDV